MVTNNGGSLATLTVTQNGDTTFGGTIADGATNKTALTITGPGGPNGLILTGVNTYSGATTLSNTQPDSTGEHISLTIAGGVLSNSPVVIQQGTLQLGGTISNNVTMSGGGVDDLGATPTPTISGSVTVTGGTATWYSAWTQVAGGVTVQGGLLYNGGTLRTPLLTVSGGSLQDQPGAELVGSLYYASPASSTLVGTIVDGAAPSALTMNNAAARLTLTGNAANNYGNASTYSGATTVMAGVLSAGAVNTLSPSSAVTISGGTLDVSRYAQSIKSLTLSSGVLNLGINGNSPVALSIANSSSTATLSGTINVLSTGFQNSGLYRLVSGYGATTGTFTQGTVPSNYRLNATATELDLVHLAQIRMLANFTYNNIVVRTGASTVGVTISNEAPANSDSIYYQLSAPGVSGLDGSSGTVAGLSAVYPTGSYTATAGVNTLTVSAVNTTSNPWLIASDHVPIKQTAYDYANPSYTSGATVALGNVRVGGTATGSLAVSNATITNASYQDNLNVATTLSNSAVTATGFSGQGAGTGAAERALQRQHGGGRAVGRFGHLEHDVGAAVGHRPDGPHHDRYDDQHQRRRLRLRPAGL